MIIDLDTIGYFLFMEKQEQEEREPKDEENFTDACGRRYYNSLSEESEALKRDK